MSRCARGSGPNRRRKAGENGWERERGEVRREKATELSAATRDLATGVACVVASAVAFGAMAVLARIAFASGVDTPTLLALRFAIASVVMLAIMLARGQSVPRGSTLGVLIGLGALGYGGQAVTYFTALAL